MEHERSPGESERYELADVFDDLGPESELVLRAIGMVIVLVALGLALAYPWLVG